MYLHKRILSVVFAASALVSSLFCDDKSSGSAQQPVRPAAVADIAYKLQPSDEVTIRSLQVKELADKVIRIDQQGDVNLPLAGHFHLGGLTIAEAEILMVGKLKKYYVEPDIELSVAALHTEPFSVVGSVGAPGIHEMKTRTTLIEAISLAGGVKPDAGPTAVITREAAYGPIPYPTARVLLASSQSVAEINLRSLLSGEDPKENFLVQPHDVISIASAQMVFVVGNVKRSGGFSLSGKADLSVIQALALCEGLDPRAAPQRARILRRGTEQIPVDLKKILTGKAEDITLQPNDILFVPSNTAKVITTRTIETAIQIGAGVAIFHF